jgi:hypothetical protein
MEETEKLRAEVARSLQVIEMKKAHKEIEELEKTRKRAAVLSVCNRLMDVAKDCNTTTKAVHEAIKKNQSINSFAPTINSINSMYMSVCFDFRKTVDMKSEDYAIMFPDMTIKLKDNPDVVQSMINLTTQLIHMKYYCDRLL